MSISAESSVKIQTKKNNGAHRFVFRSEEEKSSSLLPVDGRGLYVLLLLFSGLFSQNLEFFFV